MERIKYPNKFISVSSIVLFFLFFLSCTQSQNNYFQGIPVVASYSYHLSGRTDRVHGYLIRIENISKFNNPCLMFIAQGVDADDGAYAMVNGVRYDFPPIVSKSGLILESSSNQELGKRGFYALNQTADLLGKIVIPLNPDDLKEGINKVSFYKVENSDGYEVFDSCIKSVDIKAAEVVGVTYRIIARGRPATIDDFDFISNYGGENKLKQSDVPDWARRGKVRFYRAGNVYENLDRMFEMFHEARINLVTTHVPSDTKSNEYVKIKAFIDRCHTNGIKVTAFFSLGGIRLSDVMMNPNLKNWVSKDEYGDLRWREHGGTYLADLTNEAYIKERLNAAKAAIDIGVDEIYFDYAIGGTGEVIDFMSKIRDLVKKEGNDVSIYGNCKGDILVDDLCDLTKSEGIEEPGIFNRNWVHNVTQSKFYYAAGDGWKAYRSKYEGADPGVANPGAYDIREGMKYGWKRPIAEASAFQSHFAIAEAGEKLVNGWVNKDNKLAMEIWDGIVRYYQFLEKNEEYFTDVRTISRVGVLAPPVIPSFEVALSRVPLFNTLAEQNIMYDVLLLPRINVDLLSKYQAIIIPDIPYVDEKQFKIIEEYKSMGGKIYTIGSISKLRELADVYSPISLIQNIDQETQKNEFYQNLQKLTGEPLISLENAPYVIVNSVKKVGTDKVILHFVNYSEPIENIQVKVNFEGLIEGIDKDRVFLLSPDSVLQEIKDVDVDGNKIEFTIPKLEIYNIISIN